MKCLFIINPSSGTHAFQKSIDKFIGQLILNTNVNTIDTYFTRGKNDGLERAARLTRNEYDFIVAVGGDGTINEIITGLIKSESKIPLAILAAGTVNDFATYLNLPNTPEAFRDMIARFKTKKIDAGYVEGMDYNASKAGVISLTHDFAKIYAPRVRVNAVAPGWIETTKNKELLPNFKKEEMDKCLLGRFASPDEIASVIFFLSSRDASYINDSIIKVDGGLK